MFSGIVEELGEVVRLQRKGKVSFLEIKASTVIGGTKPGDSIAVNGVCLTVVERTDSSVCFEVMPETSSVTTLGAMHRADKVNLERALRVGDRLSGHFVLGHVDCTGVIRKKYYKAGNLCVDIRYPAQCAAFVFLKGSVAVDGISLTIAEKKSGMFSVYIIPHTLKNTTFGFKGPSSIVNLEFDILAKKACGYSA